MDGAAFKEALVRLGYSQSGFAREHNIPLRTVQNWARSGPPDFAGPILTAMVRQSVKPPEAQSWVSNEAAAAECARAFDMPLQSLLHGASRAGWSREVALAGLMTWLAGQIINKR